VVIASTPGVANVPAECSGLPRVAAPPGSHSSILFDGSTFYHVRRPLSLRMLAAHAVRSCRINAPTRLTLVGLSGWFNWPSALIYITLGKW
jgi:hypothetical protein